MASVICSSRLKPNWINLLNWWVFLRKMEKHQPLWNAPLLAGAWLTQAKKGHRVCYVKSFLNCSSVLNVVTNGSNGSTLREISVLFQMEKMVFVRWGIASHDITLHYIVFYILYIGSLFVLIYSLGRFWKSSFLQQ